MSHSDAFVQQNQLFAENVFPGKQPAPPSKHIAVVACMDARLDPRKVLGIEVGEAHVIANAGGRAQDALRSLVISQQLLGTREIHILQHTDCGMAKFTNEILREKLRSEMGTSIGDEIEFLTFTEVEESVKQDVQMLRNHDLILKDSRIVGWVYQCEDGRIRKIIEA